MSGHLNGASLAAQVPLTIIGIYLLLDSIIQPLAWFLGSQVFTKKLSQKKFAKIENFEKTTMKANFNQLVGVVF